MLKVQIEWKIYFYALNECNDSFINTYFYHNVFSVNNFSDMPKREKMSRKFWELGSRIPNFTKSALGP